MPGDTPYYDPNDPNMGSQTDPGQRGSANQDVFLSFSQALNDLPAYREWLRRNANGGTVSDAQKAELRQVIEQAGLAIPPGMDIDNNGAVLPVDRTTRNWLITAGLVALPFAVQGIGALAGAGGVGGAGASAPSLGGGSTIAANLGAASAIPAVAAPTAAAAGAGSVTAAVQGTEAGIYGGAGSATAGSSPSLLSRIGAAATSDRTSRILDAAGNLVSAGTQAAGQNRTDAFDANTRANNMYENQLMARSRDEQAQRSQALKDVYRSSWYANRQASPNNTRGLTAISPEMQATLDALRDQGKTKLATGAQYDSNAVDPLTRPEMPGPGTLERVGTYAGPILTGLGKLGKIFGKK